MAELDETLRYTLSRYTAQRVPNSFGEEFIGGVSYSAPALPPSWAPVLLTSGSSVVDRVKLAYSTTLPLRLIVKHGGKDLSNSWPRGCCQIRVYLILTIQPDIFPTLLCQNRLHLHIT
jgi:hypothetical protein